VFWRRKPVLCASAGAGVALAVLAAAAVPGAAGAATSAPALKAFSGSTPVTVSADPFGIDVGPWDTLYSNPADVGAMDAYLKAVGINQLHYGGGGTADQYDWQNNTVVNNSQTCGPAPTIAAFTSGCETNEPFSFQQFSANARGLGAQSFVTVNYGSGTPALAAQWVTESAKAGEGVSQWSIGNESYGCWSYDTWLTQPPADDTDYVANRSGCPMATEDTGADGMTTMAGSYAYNAGQYMAAMATAAQEAGVSIKFGVPWAFDSKVGGASVGNNSIWNNTVLGSPYTNQYIGYVEAHWYPFSFGGDVGLGGNQTAQQVIQSVEMIPGEYGKIKAGLILNNLPNATVTIGETGVSYQATNVPCIPAGALFAGGDALEWLSSGAQTIDWWPMETGSNPGSACSLPDEAMFTGNGTPDTFYTGFLLASQLAKPNAQLSSLTVGDVSDPADSTDTFGFQSVLPDGQVVVALFNAHPTIAQKVKINSSLAGNLTTETYSAGNQNASNSKIVDGTTTASAIAGSINLPAQSIVVLKSYDPTSVTLSAATSVKAGTKVTLSGKLTLNGAAAPAGKAVKIYRRIAGSSVNSATLSVTTRANGTFTATNVPPGGGSYNYVASYAGTSVYAAASATFQVHVTAIKPTLKLKFSAGTVKTGRKVTVTATLSGWHTNRTLVIYAQPKGGKKTVIKRATINAKGQLAVSYTMRVNTTFTVTFSGDAWYSSGSASGVVKA
jgi:hypothetical protein